MFHKHLQQLSHTPPLSDKAVIIRLIEGDLIKVRKSTDSSEGYHQSLIDIKPEKVVEKLTALLAKQVDVKKALEEVEMDWLAAQEELETMLQA